MITYCNIVSVCFLGRERKKEKSISLLIFGVWLTEEEEGKKGKNLS